MTQEEKQLLLKDICARLPYGVKAQVIGWDEEKGEVAVPLKIYSINTDGYVYFETNDYDVNYLHIEACRLYLRPLSSMTEKEVKELYMLLFRVERLGIPDISKEQNAISLLYDWFHKHHFDYRGLIPKGLALEAPEEIYINKL